MKVFQSIVCKKMFYLTNLENYTMIYYKYTIRIYILINHYILLHCRLIKISRKVPLACDVNLHQNEYYSLRYTYSRRFLSSYFT